MYKIVINQLLEIASSNDIKVGWNHELSKYTPPVSAPNDKCIVMNVNWHNQKEIPFQLAHEIAHIQNGDDECITFYHATFSSKEMIEREANLGAIKLLLPIYKDMECEMNPVTFMKLFSVPGYLFDNVLKEMRN